MNFEQIITLVKTVSDSELTAFQYEEAGQKITIQAGSLQQELSDCDNLQTETAQSKRENQQPLSQLIVDYGKTETEETKETGQLITSPLVGRFYTAPGEEADNFVKIGDRVQKGQTLAIVEAMKLMNEIESDYDGVVTKVLAQNGDTVEYGQPLFCIQEG